MEGKTNPRVVARLKRKKRTRSKSRSGLLRPRLCVFRSNRHIYAQVVDDAAGSTLVSCSTLSPEVKAALDGKSLGIDAAKQVGEVLAVRCKDKGINKVVFDKNGFVYRHKGRVAGLAEGARKGGLEF